MESVKFSGHIRCKLFNNTKAFEFVAIINRIRAKYHENRKLDQNIHGFVKIIDIADEILKDTGYEALLMTEGDQERLDNISELKNSILSYETMSGEKVDIEDYLTKVALFTTEDTIKEKNGVKLMTIHAAKGLEFPYVFVCGLNEGLFPSSRVQTRDELEEERRLAYVAFTRAEKKLFMTDAEGFHHNGKTRYPSRFIFNIKPNLIDREGDIDDEFIKKAHEEILISEQVIDNVVISNNYSIGAQINHSTFGDGKIINIESETNNYIIKFDNFATHRNIKRNFGGLKKL